MSIFALNSPAKKSAIIIVVLLAIVGLFEFLPAVDHARSMFPADWNKGQDCYDVLSARPWYGQINPWFWFWMISTPAIIFSVKPSASVWQRAVRTILIIIVSYFAINLRVPLSVDIRNTPFWTSEITSTSTEIERFKFECYDTTDGPNYVFAAFFGWLPAAVYAGWWEIIWYQYHKRKTRLIGKNFKRDWVNKIVVFISVAMPVLFVILIGIDWLRKIRP